MTCVRAILPICLVSLLIQCAVARDAVVHICSEYVDPLNSDDQKY